MAAKRKRKATARHRARHNPLGRVRRRRHSRNPFAGDTLNNNVKLIAGATGGLLGEELIPRWLLALMNRTDGGMWSYILAALAVVLPAWLFAKVNWNTVAKGWLAGGGAALVWRAIDDVTKSNYLTVQAGMGSFLTQQNVVLPGPNLFGQFARGQRMLPAASSSSALAPSSMRGVGYVKYPFAA